jgi:hypothetical protein
MHCRARVLLVVGILALMTGVAVSATQGEPGASAASPVTTLAWHGSNDLRASPAGSLRIEPAQRVPSLEPHLSAHSQTAATTNWAGYVATGTQFTGVSGTWVVPAVQASASTEAAATWIGIDGYSDDSLIQTGTEEVTSGGTTSYNAWYELIPAGPVDVGNVEPGDVMQAAIAEVSPGIWSISLEDTTSQQSASGEVSYSSPGASAEWIEEAPSTDSGQLVPLANFGTVQFSNIAMTASDPGVVTQTAVDMVDSDQNLVASPGPLVNNSFTVTDDSSAPTPVATTTHGYWLVGSDGGIFTFGSAQFYGSTGDLVLQRPVVGMTLTADRRGYWLVASDGGVFTFGDAGFFNSIPGLGIAPAGSTGTGRKLNAPIVGMVPSANGDGYFMVASDGGVFAFGDAEFQGSCPGIGGCSGAAVTVMPDASGGGYWLVTATGHVYAFGNAATFGEPGSQSTPVTSAVRTPDGGGYWILFANGVIDGFGDAMNYGDPVNETGGLNPATAIFPTADGAGYWVSAGTGAVYAYGDAPNDGGTTGTHLNGSIIAGVGF